MTEGLLIAVLELLVGAVGGAAGFIGAMFTKFGERFIEQRFDKQLEEHRSGLQRQIEQLKTRLAHFSDRSSRSNQFEYDAITSAWTHYVKAHQATLACIIRFSEHPDFDCMTNEQLDDYLSTTELSDPQKKQVKEAPKKTDMYMKVLRLRGINIAGTAIYETHQVLANKGIFIPDDLEKEFEAALDFCSRAWAVEKTNFSYGNSPESGKVILEFMEKEKAMRLALKNLVRARILAAYPTNEALPE